MSAPHPDRRMLEGLVALLGVSTYEQVLFVLQQYPEVTSQEAEELLADTFERFDSSAKSHRSISDFLALLKRAREIGAEAAIADAIQNQDLTLKKIEEAFAGEEVVAVKSAIGEDAEAFYESALSLVDIARSHAEGGSRRRELLFVEGFLNRCRDRGIEAALIWRNHRRAIGNALTAVADAESLDDTVAAIERSGLLLEHRALETLREMAAESDDEEETRVLLKFASLFELCRKMGVRRACAARLAHPEIQPALERLAFVVSLADLGCIIEEYPVLLDEKAVEIILARASEEVLDQGARQQAIIIAFILRSCRRLGFDSALFLGQRAFGALAKLVRVKRWSKVRRIMYMHPELLVEEVGAAEMLEELINDRPNRVHLSFLRDFLRRARQVGVEQTISELNARWPTVTAIFADRRSPYWSGLGMNHISGRGNNSISRS